MAINFYRQVMISISSLYKVTMTRPVNFNNKKEVSPYNVTEI